jgi:hypothetical protein
MRVTSHFGTRDMRMTSHSFHSKKEVQRTDFLQPAVIVEYRDEGLTPEIPSNCPQKLVELMQMCWKKQPQQRPVSFLFVCFVFVISSLDQSANYF